MNLNFISGMIFSILATTRCKTVIVNTIERHDRRVAVCLDLYANDFDFSGIGYHGAIGTVELAGVEYHFIPIFRELDLTRPEYTHLGELSYEEFQSLRGEIRYLLAL